MHSRHLLAATLACCAAAIPAAAFEPDTDLSSAWVVFVGAYDTHSHQDEGRFIVSSAGDVDADGFDDILVGRPKVPKRRAVYLLLGRASGWAAEEELEDADACFLVEDTHDLYEGAVSEAGDVDGDGYADFLIGASNSQEAGYFMGEVYLVLGRDSGWGAQEPLADADASFRGYADRDYAGASLAAAGDVNGDGLDDFLIGAPSNQYNDESNGRAHLVLGRTSGWETNTSLADTDVVFVGEASTDMAGASLAGLGDVDGDGYDDFLIGAPRAGEGTDRNGYVYLFLGGGDDWTGEISMSEADGSWVGTSYVSSAGYAVAGAGDVNGDGLDDLLIGSPGTSNGRAHLVLGRTGGWAMDESLGDSDASYWSWDHNTGIGYSLAGVGDVDGDGYDDMLVGAQAQTDDGITYLIFGGDAGWAPDTEIETADASFIGSSDESAGTHVAAAGDVNGDDAPDFLVAGRKGRVYLVRGEPDCVDDDGDGFGSPGAFTCPGGEEEDCDDTDAAIFPGADDDPCDDLDSDCNGIHDEHADHDGDGMSTCEGDCDEYDVDTYLGADEACDGLDNDCDGAVPDDEEDDDADGFMTCDGDCDPSSDETYPGAPELCDGEDNDCDTIVPDDELDLDGDGTLACIGDCDDEDAGVHPGADEDCEDGIDNDCNGYTDEYDASCEPHWADDPDEGGCECTTPSGSRGSAAPALALLLTLLASGAVRRGTWSR